MEYLLLGLERRFASARREVVASARESLKDGGREGELAEWVRKGSVVGEGGKEEGEVEWTVGVNKG